MKSEEKCNQMLEKIEKMNINYPMKYSKKKEKGKRKG